MDLKTLISVITMLQGASILVQIIIAMTIVVILIALLSKIGVIKFILGKFKKDEISISTVSTDIKNVDIKLDHILENTKNMETNINSTISTSIKDVNGAIEKELYRLTLSVDNVANSVKDIKYELNNHDDVKYIRTKLDTIDDSTGRGY